MIFHTSGDISNNKELIFQHLLCNISGTIHHNPEAVTDSSFFVAMRRPRLKLYSLSKVSNQEIV